ncbi:MAG: hypothetical protein CL566_07820 [Alphaproteobacteria bacterium]|nr:hypothetical protein [Alphaproteobacteria bacterium]
MRDPAIMASSTNERDADHAGAEPVREPGGRTRSAFPEDVLARFHSLGKLKSLTRDQEYGIPRGIDLDDWGSVVVWCDTFKTAFAVGTIEPV